MTEPWLLVDGYNLLLALLEREKAPVDDAVLPRARTRLAELLQEFGRTTERPIALVWDGPGERAARPLDGLRVVHVEPPAEADDWIVAEAERLARQGRPPLIASRDRGLLRRLPRGCRAVDFGRLAADLAALAAAPLAAPHVRGAGEDPGADTPASGRPIDPERLPRRRAAWRATATPEAREKGAPSERHRPAAAPREAEARAAARSRRESRRRRWERAQARRRSGRKGRR